MISKTVGRLAAMSTIMQFRLLDLPTELIAHIIEAVDKIETLRKLASTCRRIQHIAEPVLYRRMLIQTGAKASHILRSFRARPERASALHILDIPCDSYYMQDVGVVVEVVTAAKALRELMIESPSCNEAEFESEDTWRPMTDRIFRPFEDAVGELEVPPRPLQKLTKCK